MMYGIDRVRTAKVPPWVQRALRPDSGKPPGRGVSSSSPRIVEALGERFPYSGRSSAERRRLMKTLAVTNQKGGSGKTTTAVNIAAALGEGGRQVLVVDLDPQASASAWLGVKDGSRGLLEVFTNHGNLAALVRETGIPGVDLVPSSTWLASVEKALAGEVGAELVLREAMAELSELWDFILLDCPPSLGLLTVSALCVAREVLVPVEVSSMALAGLAGVMQTVDRVRDRLNPDLAVSEILVCRADARTNLSREVVERLRERFGKLVMNTVVRETVRLREAWSFAQPVTTYDPRGRGAEDYRSAAAELLERRQRT